MGLNPNQPINWYNSLLSKSNQYCLYCGCLVGINSKIESNEEHLIAKNFVPEGSFLDGTEFNFIFRACKKCNDEKGNIERHISSISIYNNPERITNKTIDDLARRKGNKDFHPDKKGKLIKDSFEELNLSFNSHENLNFSLNMSSPPQAKKEYIILLSFRHIQGLFSLITSKNNSDKIKILLPEHFICFGCFIVNDWGNEQLLEIIKRVADWPCYANINTANGYFKEIIRCNEKDNKEWFWALEWNKYFRIIGLIADRNIKQKLFENLPKIKIINTGKCLIYKEKPINKSNDFLFSGIVVDN